MHKVHSSFINPFVFNRLRSNEPYIEGVVMADGITIECEGEQYALTDGVKMTPFEPVWLCLYNRFFHVETKVEHEQRVLERLKSQWNRREENER